MDKGPVALGFGTGLMGACLFGILGLALGGGVAFSTKLLCSLRSDLLVIGACLGRACIFGVLAFGLIGAFLFEILGLALGGNVAFSTNLLCSPRSDLLVIGARLGRACKFGVLAFGGVLAFSA